MTYISWPAWAAVPEHVARQLGALAGKEPPLDIDGVSGDLQCSLLLLSLYILQVSIVSAFHWPLTEDASPQLY